MIDAGSSCQRKIVADIERATETAGVIDGEVMVGIGIVRAASVDDGRSGHKTIRGRYVYGQCGNIRAIRRDVHEAAGRNDGCIDVVVARNDRSARQIRDPVGIGIGGDPINGIVDDIDPGRGSGTAYADTVRGTRTASIDLHPNRVVQDGIGDKTRVLDLVNGNGGRITVVVVIKEVIGDVEEMGRRIPIDDIRPVANDANDIVAGDGIRKYGDVVVTHIIAVDIAKAEGQITPDFIRSDRHIVIVIAEID